MGACARARAYLRDRTIRSCPEITFKLQSAQDSKSILGNSGFPSWKFQTASKSPNSIFKRLRARATSTSKPRRFCECLLHFNNSTQERRFGKMRSFRERPRKKMQQHPTCAFAAPIAQKNSNHRRACADFFFVTCLSSTNSCERGGRA